MYKLKVNYWRDMGDPVNGILIHAGSEIEAMPVYTQMITGRGNARLMYKIRPLGASEWCSKLIHPDNILIEDTPYYTMPKSELYPMLAASILITVVCLYMLYEVIQ